jgi:hypothetical protein
MQALLQLIGEIVLGGSSHSLCQHILQPETHKYLSTLGVFQIDPTGVLGTQDCFRRLQNRVVFDAETETGPDADNWICFAADVGSETGTELALVGVDNDAFLSFVWHTEWLRLWWAQRKIDMITLEMEMSCDFVRAFQRAVVDHNLPNETALHALLREQQLVCCVTQGPGDQLLACIANTIRQTQGRVADLVTKNSTFNKEIWEPRFRQEKSGRSWSDFESQHAKWNHGKYTDVVADGLQRAIFVICAHPVSGTLYVPCFICVPPYATHTTEPLLLLYHTLSCSYQNVTACPFKLSDNPPQNKKNHQPNNNWKIR